MAIVNGTRRRDRLNGTREDDEIDGRGGDDVIIGRGGNDILIGGDGADEVHGGLGADYLTGGLTTSARGDLTQDMLLGGRGYDFILGGYNDIVDGEEDGAYLVLDWSGLAIFRGKFGASSDFANGAGWVRNVDAIQLELTSGNDIVIADGAYLKAALGGRGDDRFYGGRHSTSFYGEDGDDQMIVGRGETYFYGGAGFDTVSYARHDGPIEVELNNYPSSSGSVARMVNGRVRTDRIGDVEHLIGTAHDDRIVGGGIDDWQVPDSPPSLEWLEGGAGNDHIDGRAGNDRLDGGDGDDVLTGGRGLDTLIGGAGADRFVFRRDYESGGIGTPADRIIDFSSVDGDRIDLSEFDGDTLALDWQAVIFIGASAPTGRAGELWYTTVGSTTFIHIDTDGDGATNFDVRLNGVSSLSAADFIL